MLNYEYKKDFSRSYLILTGVDEQAGSYETNILIKNNIRGFLGCQIHNINSEYKLFYDITSRQSLDSAFAVREMGYEDVKNLFLMLQAAVGEMRKYLLDGSDLVLEVRHIYMEPEKEQIWFVYFPGYHGSVQEGLQNLTDFLLNKIDHKDPMAVDFTYWLYDYVRKEQFSILKIMEYFQNKDPAPQIQCHQEIPSGLAEPEDSAPDCDGEAAPVPVQRSGSNIRQKGFPIILYLLIPILAEAAAAIFLFKNYEMTVQEITVLFGIYGIILAAGGIGIYVKLVRGSDGIEMEAPEEFPLTVPTESRNENLEEECFGETTFLGGDSARQQKLLLGKIKGKEIQIELDTFPFVIGKMKGKVNYVLQDMSVSRMHVKFYQKDGTDEIYMMDLNSTNGTNKNGVPLDVNEEVLIRPGDEIQLGKLSFTYH